ncbi:MAG: hypothetical protein WC378_12195 [Opitutaceae bacterium]|jgi:N-acetylmuramic acid 6-phosphate (MurNAc-6-P) etherase
MKTSDSHAFVNQLLIYTLVMICTSGSVGLGTVWLRYQISATANRVKLADQKIAECERRLAEAVTDTETEQSPDVLKRRNEQWKLGLTYPKETQVCRVKDDVEMRLAAKRNQGLFTDGASFVAFKPGASGFR